MGFLITENPLVIQAINLAGKAFNDLGDQIKANSDAIIEFSIGLVEGLVRSLAFVIRRVGEVVSVFKNFDAVIDLVLYNLSGLAVGSIDVAETIVKGFKGVVNFGLEPLLGGVEEIATGLSRLGIVSSESLESFRDVLKDIALDSSTSGLESLRQGAEDFRTAARDSFIESSDRLLETKDGFDKAADSVDGFADSLKGLKKDADKTNKSLEQLNKKGAITAPSGAGAPAAPAAPKPGVVDNEAKRLEGIQKSFSNTLITSFTKGAAGASDLIASGIGAGVEVFAPGFGQAASEIIKFLTQGPDVVKAQVEAFINELPVVIEALAEAIPVVAEVLAENSDRIILALAEGAPRIAWAIAIEVPIALAKTLPGALDRMIIDFREGVVLEFDKLFGSLNISSKNFTSGLTKGLMNIINQIGNFPETFRKAIFEGLTALKTELTNGASRFVNGIITKLPEIILALADQIRVFFQAIGQNLAVGLFNSLLGVGDAIVQKISEFFARIDPTRGVSSVSSGGIIETVGGAIQEVSNTISDTFTGSSFGSFGLTGEAPSSQSQPIQVVLQIGQKQLADVILDLNRQGYRTA